MLELEREGGHPRRLLLSNGSNAPGHDLVPLMSAVPIRVGYLEAGGN